MYIPFLLIASSLCRLTLGSPSPTIRKRQIVDMPLGSSPASSGDRTGGKISTTIIIPVAAVLGVLIATACIWAFRKKLFGRFKRTNTTSSNVITAQELASGRRDRAGSSTTVRAGANAGTTSTPQRNSSGRGGRGRGPRRGVRRTESGRSIMTLPEYSKEAGDEELVLVRQRSTSSISEEDEDEEEQVLSPVVEDAPTPSDPLQRDASRRSRMSTRSDRSTRSRSDARNEVEGEETQELVLPPGETTPPSGSQSAPIRQSQDIPRRTLSNASRRGWGEAPTYLEAMSSPSFQSSTLEGGVPPPRTPTLKDRTSTSFRGLLNKAGMSSFRMPTQRREMTQTSDSRHSSTSLLLQPQTSRLSTLTSSSTVREGSISPYTSPWESTHSLLHISSPVPNTAMRASFDANTMPKAGLSNDQMKFLSSSEAVNLVGVKMGDVPTNKRRRRSEANSLSGSPGRGVDELPPPSWEDIQAEAGPSGSGSAQSGDVEDVSPRAGVVDLPVVEGDITDGRSVTGPRGVDLPTIVIPQPTTGTSEAPSVEIEPPTPISAYNTPTLGSAASTGGHGGTSSVTQGGSTAMPTTAM